MPEALTATAFIARLEALQSDVEREKYRRYFKSGDGEYGEGGAAAVTSFACRAPVLYWRGPAPFVFARLPDDIAAEIRRSGRAVTYGWGVIPVAAAIEGVSFTTLLFPKDDTYLLPLTLAVRRRLGPSAEREVAADMRIEGGGER